MFGLSTICTLSFGLLEIRLSSADGTYGSIFCCKVTGFIDSCLFSSDIVNKFSKSGKFTICVPAEHSESDVGLPHAVDHYLLDHLVPETDLHGAGALDSHAAHVSHGGYSGSKCTNCFICLLYHFPKIHEVDGLVDCDDGQLLHLLNAEVRGGEVGVGTGVEDPLSELCITSCV